jgi:type IV secretion system protein VirB5
MASSPLRHFSTLALLCVVAPAHAQFAVIDVAALTQLVSELQTLEQQVATARSQLSQAQAEYQSITGSRGMQQLLAGTTRNYLPQDWTSLQAALHGTGPFPTLSSDLQTALKSAAVLSPQQLATLSPTAVLHLQSARASAALQQSLSHEALANASGRFAAIQQLIDSIARAPDQKAILELQARIAAEVGMLQNENTKLQAMFQTVQAQAWSDAQRERELDIAAHGAFTIRFQPHP